MKKFVILFFSLTVPFPVFSQGKINTGLNIGYFSSTFTGNDIPGKGQVFVLALMKKNITLHLINSRLTLLSGHSTTFKNGIYK